MQKERRGRGKGGGHHQRGRGGGGENMGKLKKVGKKGSAPSLSPYLCLVVVVVADVEVAQFVRRFGGCHHVQEITKLLLFQILFGQVFQVALGKGRLGSDTDLISFPGYLH